MKTMVAVVGFAISCGCSLLAADSGKSDSAAASSSSASHSSGGGGGGGSSAAEVHTSGGGGGGSSAPEFHSGGGGGSSSPSVPVHTGGGGGAPGHSPGGGRPEGGGPFHPGEFHFNPFARHYEIEKERERSNSRASSFFDNSPQGGPQRIPIINDHPGVVLPAASIPNPSAAELTRAFGHHAGPPILGPRWLPASAHPAWDKAAEHLWNNHRYRWYDNGWLMIDDSFWPPDGNDSCRPALFVTSGSDVDTLVYDIQSKLRRLRYYRGKIDGDNGPLTREAIEEYQRDNHLPVTGTINDRLAQSLGLE
ncbi:MAG TPA: peptidoglycan-binding domain-containing protein [Chthoniobacteraceae bacterium]|nr:peptidoglycan-binding domain-containing protein [Chthoniobacteraceae bacterium]